MLRVHIGSKYGSVTIYWQSWFDFTYVSEHFTKIQSHMADYVIIYHT